MKYSVMVTAHREISLSDILIISHKMKELVSDPEIETIYFGGASGGDTLALETCLKFRKNKFPKLIVMLPKDIKFQHPNTHEITSEADEIISLGLSRKLGDIWQIRDFKMVDLTQKCLAFFDTIEAGGVFNCLNYARQQDKIVEVVKINGRNK